MSLVGSLEDLGLGDILQIVSMARKSGVLVLRSDAGEGRILFRDGTVRAAFAKGEPEDLRALLVGGGFLAEAEFDRAADAARGGSLDAALAEHTTLTAERLASLRREHVERSVVRMFTWKSGEFSFDVREDVEARDTELMLAQGLNTQYLAMEAMRLGDESQRDGAVAAAGDAGAGSAVDEASPDDLARSALEGADAAAASETGGPPLAALIAIDPELDALEWEKAALAGLFPRIHIFQRCESGITRIRQYLGRGELPVVLLSARAHDDDGVDVDDLGGLVARLRTQAPQMPILVIHEDAEPAPAGVEAADQVVKRPTTGRLKAARAARKREEAAHALREALQPWAARSKGRDRGGRPGSGAAAPGGGAEATDGQGGSPPPSPEPPEPSAPGDVLRGVLALAAQAFNRVALFLCTDEGLVGMAQVGLARAGGPPDARFRELRVDPREPSWFRTVIETGQAICSAPRDEADFRLVQLLGTAAPPEAYLAPIAGGGRVVALIYGDNLPEAKPAGDTTALEIALHQAGQALDRALGLRLPAAGEGAPRGAPEEI